MTLTLYSMNENRNKIDKNLPDVHSENISFTARADFDILNPIIILSENDPRNYNYVFISELNRYYFIEKIEAIRNGVYKCFLHVDVLKTYSTSIKSLNADIIKSENPNEDYFNTEFSENTVVNEIMFNDNFNHNGVNVLITATN